MKMRTTSKACLCFSLLFGLLPASAYEQPSPALKSVTQAAKQAYMSHDYDLSIAKYQQAIKLAQNTSPRALIILNSNLGAALREAHKWSESQEAFKAAISCAEKNNLEKDPSAKNAMSQYAVLLRRMGKNVDAQLMESRALGTALVVAAVPNQPDSAEAETSQAAKISMAPPPVAATGAEKNLSIEQIKQMLARDPDNFNLTELLAQRYCDDRKWEQALNVLQLIQRKFPNRDGALHQRLAQCYGQMGDNTNAISEAQADLAANPTRSSDYLLLHGFYMDMGDIKGATASDESYLSKFSQNDQYYPTIQHFLESLKHFDATKGDKPNALEQKQNWPASFFPLKVYGAPVNESFHLAHSGVDPSEQTPSDVLNNCLDAWARASQQRVSFIRVDRPQDANIEVNFTINPNGLEPGVAGVTQWGQMEEHQKVRISVLIVNPNTSGPVTPEKLTNTVLHELGHALGIQHSSLPEDIMYPQEHPQPQTALSENDAKRVMRLYSH
jgi:hypothetical protein